MVKLGTLVAGFAQRRTRFATAVGKRTPTVVAFHAQKDEKIELGKEIALFEATALKKLK